ncbi:hypothetical protein M2323_004369 [Rhodoblastus acidophilus]|uniref:hypothetical protein n=1 Tax=Rhodoblastus acidophilus TaxID=1074 RepID=UPI002224A8B2|nr:hypothetical protein [Rhodoblastus acidophilus]MCW2286572.1 hypothetical protein [Rhodoblastus acidophilus]MCW2335421.1 hypothetical protein [Rhodoblastus acidophilus]
MAKAESKTALFNFAAPRPAPEKNIGWPDCIAWAGELNTGMADEEKTAETPCIFGRNRLFIMGFLPQALTEAPACDLNLGGRRTQITLARPRSRHNVASSTDFFGDR